MAEPPEGPEDGRMDAQADAPARAEIDAYVDGRLALAERMAVERWLAAHPAAAASVMADLALRDSLRLAFTAEDLMAPADAAPVGPLPAGARAATDAAAQRLASALRADRRALRLRRIAALLMLFGLGWLAHAGIGPLSVRGLEAAPPPPAYLAAALEAHRTGQLRAVMASQPQAPLDRAEIRAATGLALPSLPAGWQVLDTQIFPSPLGPSVEMALDAPEGRLSLFAIRPGSFDVRRPALMAGPDLAAAHFQIGEAAYVLVGPPELSDLAREAEGLFATLH